MKDILSSAGHRGESHSALLLANPKIKAEYGTLAPEFEIAAELLRACLHAGLSQAELATRIGTSQSTIARLESGQTLPSMKTLLRHAKATGSKFHVRPSAWAPSSSGVVPSDRLLTVLHRRECGPSLIYFAACQPGSLRPRGCSPRGTIRHRRHFLH